MFFGDISSHLSFKKVSFEWKIEYFFDGKDYDGRIKSPNFLLSNISFYLEISFNFDVTLAEDSWVALTLCRESYPGDVRVVYTMGLKNVDNSVLKSCTKSFLFRSNRAVKATPPFIERLQRTKAENLFESNNTLTIFFDASIASDSTAGAESQTSTTDYFETLSRNLENVFINGYDTDSSIDVKGEKFSAHRLILSARSSVFRSMFEAGMNETETGVVTITDCDPGSFRAFLLFLYSGKLDVVSPRNALSLYTTADKYDVQDLKEACRQCMTQHLCVDSICDVLRLAALHKEQELLKDATAYFINNASEILKTLKWKTLVGENFTLTNELLIKTIENSQIMYK